MSINRKMLHESEEFSKLIADAVYDSYNKHLPDIKAGFKIKRPNGQYQFVWGLIYADIEEKISQEDFITVPLDRGRWQVLVIFSKLTKYLYVVMSENRAHSVISSRNKRVEQNKHHYIDFLNLYDEIVRETFLNRQISMLEPSACDWIDERSELQGKFSSVLKEDIKQFSLITFKRNKTDILNLSAHLLDSNLQIVYTEDWSNYLVTEYVQEAEITNEALLEDYEDQIPLGLKTPVNLNEARINKTKIPVVTKLKNKIETE